MKYNIVKYAILRGELFIRYQIFRRNYNCILFKLEYHIKFHENKTFIKFANINRT